MAYLQLAIEATGYILAALELFRKTAHLEDVADNLGARSLHISQEGVSDRTGRILLIVSYCIVGLFIFGSELSDKHTFYILDLFEHEPLYAVFLLVISLGAISLAGFMIMYALFFLTQISLLVLFYAITRLLALFDSHPGGSVGGFGLLLTISPRLIGWLFGDALG